MVLYGLPGPYSLEDLDLGGGVHFERGPCKSAGTPVCLGLKEFFYCTCKQLARRLGIRVILYVRMRNTMSDE